jgi:hypothetical protein
VAAVVSSRGQYEQQGLDEACGGFVKVEYISKRKFITVCRGQCRLVHSSEGQRRVNHWMLMESIKKRWSFLVAAANHWRTGKASGDPLGSVSPGKSALFVFHSYKKIV